LNSGSNSGKKPILFIVGIVFLTIILISALTYYLFTAPPKKSPVTGPTPASPSQDEESKIKKILDKAAKLMKDRKPREALPYYNEVLEMEPDNAPALAGRTNAKIDLGMFKEAMEDAQKAIKLAPKYPLNYVNRGNVYYYTGRIEEAIADYKRTIEMNPTYPPDESKAHYGLGRIHSDGKRYKQALEEFHLAVKMHDVERNYMSRGVTYRMLGQNSLAIKDFQIAHNKRPDKAVILVYLGDSLIEEDDEEKALEYFNKAIEIDPNFDKDADFRGPGGKRPTNFIYPYTSRGVIYNNRGKFDLAINDFSRAMEIKPNSLMDYIGRAYAYWNNGNMEKAREDAKKYLLLTKKPDNQDDLIDYLEDGAVAYAILGKNDKALELVNHAAKLEPSYTRIYLIRGMIRQQLGDREKAVQDFNQVVKNGNKYEAERATELMNR